MVQSKIFAHSQCIFSTSTSEKKSHKCGEVINNARDLLLFQHSTTGVRLSDLSLSICSSSAQDLQIEMWNFPKCPFFPPVNAYSKSSCTISNDHYFYLLFSSGSSVLDSEVSSQSSFSSSGPTVRTKTQGSPPTPS